MAGKSTKAARSTQAAKHPRSVPIIDEDVESEQLPDQPFAEGAQDSIDADLRHRMISEAAYHRYAERGYADGYDMDDWLQAEAEVDHLLVNTDQKATAQRGS